MLLDELLFEFDVEFCLFTFIVNDCEPLIGFSSISPNPLLPGDATTSISESDVEVTVTVFVSFPFCKNTDDGLTFPFFALMSICPYALFAFMLIVTLSPLLILDFEALILKLPAAYALVIYIVLIIINIVIILFIITRIL